MQVNVQLLPYFYILKMIKSLIENMLLSFIKIIQAFLFIIYIFKIGKNKDIIEI